MSGKAGIDKVLSDEPTEPPREDGKQLALLPETEQPQPDASGADRGESKGRGRPEGARNRRTDEMVRYLNTFGQGPLVGLARIVNMIEPATGLPDFAKIARATGLKRPAAAEFWRNCAKELAPYMHQKLPIAVDVSGDSAGSLVVINLGAVQGDPESDMDDLLGGHIGDVIDHEQGDDESEQNQ